MPTTIIGNETLDQAYARRFREEAEQILNIPQAAHVGDYITSFKHGRRGPASIT